MIPPLAQFAFRRASQSTTFKNPVDDTAPSALCFSKSNLKPEYSILRTLHLSAYKNPIKSPAISRILSSRSIYTSHLLGIHYHTDSIRKPIMVHLKVSTVTTLLLTSSFDLLNASVLLPVCSSGTLLCCAAQDDGTAEYCISKVFPSYH